jgi:hypothetical protein
MGSIPVNSVLDFPIRVFRVIRGKNGSNKTFGTAKKRYPVTLNLHLFIVGREIGVTLLFPDIFPRLLCFILRESPPPHPTARLRHYLFPERWNTEGGCLEGTRDFVAGQLVLGDRDQK